MVTAGAGQADQDHRRPAAARVTDEQRVLSIEDHAFHFAFAHVVALQLNPGLELLYSQVFSGLYLHWYCS